MTLRAALLRFVRDFAAELSAASEQSRAVDRRFIAKLLNDTDARLANSVREMESRLRTMIENEIERRYKRNEAEMVERLMKNFTVQLLQAQLTQSVDERFEAWQKSMRKEISEAAGQAASIARRQVTSDYFGRNGAA